MYAFSYSKVYDNLDIISDGNYSKDINLQKWVNELIKNCNLWNYIQGLSLSASDRQ